jgi:hypothetical protein
MNSQDSSSSTLLTSTTSNTSPTAITSNTLPTVTRKPTKEEIVAAMQECATKLGHVPS